MTFLGDLLGYDDCGNDILGVNRISCFFKCAVCGRSAFHHSPEETNTCLLKLYARREINTISKNDKEET